MKKKDLVKKLPDMGCILSRHGGKHDWYTNPRTKTPQPVPRHNEGLARHITKELGG